MIGRVVGTYKILRRLGAGGMGTVYQGVDLMLEREVAVKVLHPELVHQPNLVERFRAEAVTLARINHPNVATLYSFLREGDDFFMVMEFVHGEPLDEIIQRTGAMPLQQAVRLFCQALDGIAYAHQLGIIHRDIKPANIMVTAAGDVKVMDFGIARVLGKARMTKTGHLIGTLEYMSPEQIRGREVDARSDIYALGILLYEMITGSVPFESDSDYDLMRAQMEALPEPPRARVAHLPEAVEQVMLRALEKDPGARFQTVATFREALQEGMRAGLASSAGPATARTPEPEAVSRPTRAAEEPAPAPAPAAPATRPADEAARRGAPPTRLADEAETAPLPAATRAAEVFPGEDTPSPPGAEGGAASPAFASLLATLHLDRLGPEHYVGLGLILLLLVLVPLFWPTAPEPPADEQTNVEPQAERDAGPVTAGRDTASAAPSPVFPAPVVVPPAPGPVFPQGPAQPGPSGLETGQGVADWLAEAQRYLEQNQLTTPSGANALEACRRVLQADPGNQAAREILRQIVRRYVDWGDARRERKDYAAALDNYRKSLDVVQDFPGVLDQMAGEVRQRMTDVQTVLAAMRTGSLRILVRPFGDIYVDDAQKAKATIQPHTETLPAGTYRVRAVHPVFGTWEKAVSVQAGEDREVLFNFNEEYKLTVTSEPPNAEILLDGKATGRYTPSLLILHPGQHTVTVRKDGYLAADGAKRLTVESDAAAPLHFVLRPR